MSERRRGKDYESGGASGGKAAGILRPAGKRSIPSSKKTAATTAVLLPLRPSTAGHNAETALAPPSSLSSAIHEQNQLREQLVALCSLPTGPLSPAACECRERLRLSYEQVLLPSGSVEGESAFHSTASDGKGSASASPAQRKQRERKQHKRQRAGELADAASHHSAYTAGGGYATGELASLLWKYCFHAVVEYHRRRLSHLMVQASEPDSTTQPSGEIQSRLKTEADALVKVLHSSVLYFRQLIDRLTREHSLVLDGSFDVERAYSPHLPASALRERERLIVHAYVNCHRFLVFIGDLTRYHYSLPMHHPERDNWKNASTHYLSAVRLLPFVGQPHNQLSVYYTYTGDLLLTAYHYYRALVVREPFPTSHSNLIMLLQRYAAAPPSEAANAEHQQQQHHHHHQQQHCPDEAANAPTLHELLAALFYTHQALLLGDRDAVVPAKHYAMLLLERYVATAEANAQQLCQILVMSLAASHLVAVQPASDSHDEDACAELRGHGQRLCLETMSRVLRAHRLQGAPLQVLLPSLLLFTHLLRSQPELMCSSKSSARAWKYTRSELVFVLNALLRERTADDAAHASLETVLLPEVLAVRGFLPLSAVHNSLFFHGASSPTGLSSSAAAGQRQQLLCERARTHQILQFGHELADPPKPVDPRDPEPVPRLCFDGVLRCFFESRSKAKREHVRLAGQLDLPAAPTHSAANAPPPQTANAAMAAASPDHGAASTSSLADGAPLSMRFAKKQRDGQTLSMRSAEKQRDGQTHSSSAAPSGSAAASEPVSELGALHLGGGALDEYENRIDHSEDAVDAHDGDDNDEEEEIVLFDPQDESLWSEIAADEQHTDANRRTQHRAADADADAAGWSGFAERAHSNTSSSELTVGLSAFFQMDAAAAGDPLPQEVFEPLEPAEVDTAQSSQRHPLTGPLNADPWAASGATADSWQQAPPFLAAAHQPALPFGYGSGVLATNAPPLSLSLGGASASPWATLPPEPNPWSSHQQQFALPLHGTAAAPLASHHRQHYHQQQQPPPQQQQQQQWYAGNGVVSPFSSPFASPFLPARVAAPAAHQLPPDGYLPPWHLPGDAAAGTGGPLESPSSHRTSS
mmetsp:Transcript_42800/g.108038  ORF Transcript_42800/g.108038 Transcript_42800/m.108038 type:complete len:1098 (-) Transcript_42800:288-3581(-)